MQTIDRNILRRALAAYGTEAQWGMVMEECCEMLATFNRFRRGRASADQLIEEVADAYIMVEQAREMVGAALVDRYVTKKMERLDMKLRDLGK